MREGNIKRDASSKTPLTRVDSRLRGNDAEDVEE